MSDVATRNDVAMKKCSACDAMKPLEDFSLRAGVRLGRTSCCRPCAATRRAWRKENPGAQPPWFKDRVKSVFPNDVDPLELAWAAGLFEGEGCLSFRPSRNSYQLVIQMTDRDVVDKFCRIVGGSSVVTVSPDPRAPSNKTLYRWNAYYGPYILAFIEAFLPHLGERRRATFLTALDVLTAS